MSTYVEQLAQIFNSAVWDGDLISKDVRDKLVKDGLVTRAEGYNIITPDGVGAFLISGSKERNIDIRDSSVKLLARISARRFSTPKRTESDFIFSGAQFAGVVSDLTGLPIPDGYVVRFILSDRDWLSQGHSKSHWQIMDRKLWPSI